MAPGKAQRHVTVRALRWEATQRLQMQPAAIFKQRRGSAAWRDLAEVVCVRSRVSIAHRPAVQEGQWSGWDTPELRESAATAHLYASA
jgi:hypothetical protein